MSEQRRHPVSTSWASVRRGAHLSILSRRTRVHAYFMSPPSRSQSTQCPNVSRTAPTFSIQLQEHCVPRADRGILVRLKVNQTG